MLTLFIFACSFLPVCNRGYYCIAAAMRVVMRRVAIIEERPSAVEGHRSVPDSRC
jgi:hypothetical protein